MPRTNPRRLNRNIKNKDKRVTAEANKLLSSLITSFILFRRKFKDEDPDNHPTVLDQFERYDKMWKTHCKKVGLIEAAFPMFENQVKAVLDRTERLVSQIKKDENAKEPTSGNGGQDGLPS